MVRPLTLPVLQEPAPLSEVNEEIHLICPISRKRRDQRTRTGRSRTRHNNHRPSKTTWMLLQYQHRQEGILSHPHHHKVSSSIFTHHPLGGYMYPPPPPQQQHIPQPTQIMVQQDLDTAAALQQMAQLHQQHFGVSQNEMKALKNITSASSFTSTVGCIPIYNGKDKDGCTKWLQRCKEASFYTGYNFISVLLQRSSQDVAKVIHSLDEDLSHDRLRRLCVLCWVFQAQQQQLMNFPIYGSNQARTS